jgi:hypothetical protein
MVTSTAAKVACVASWSDTDAELAVRVSDAMQLGGRISEQAQYIVSLSQSALIAMAGQVAWIVLSVISHSMVLIVELPTGPWGPVGPIWRIVRCCRR